MMAGSDDDFDDITHTEKERDEYGAVDQDITEELNSPLSHSLLSSDTTHSSLALSAQGDLAHLPHSSLSVSTQGDVTYLPHSSLTQGDLMHLPHSSLSVSTQGDVTYLPHSSLTQGDLTHLPHSSLSVSTQGDVTYLPHSSLTQGDLTHLPHSSLSVSTQGDVTYLPHSSLTQGDLTHLPHSSLSVSAQGDVTYTPYSSVSVLAQGVPTPNTHCLSTVTGSTLSPIPVCEGSFQQTGRLDPLSLPLSTFSSLPLSTLITLLHSALTPTSSLNTPCAPSPGPAATTTVRPTPAAVSAPRSQVSVTTTTPVRPTPAARAPRLQVRRSQPHQAPTSSTSPSGSWSTRLSPVDIAPFTQPVGPTVPIPTSELELFRLFFTDDICSFITEQTNLYAQQVLGEEYSEWEHVTVQELRAYFGFMMLMGLYPKPAITDYWRKDPFVNYAPIADRISRDRFLQIHRYLHFSDNTLLPQLGESGYDRLGKVRPVMEKLQERFLEVYYPHCENAIDEAMIPFQGRSSLKQYMPAKPVKRGIKVWCRADSHNGYMCEMQVYTGRSESAESGLGKRIVLDLSERLVGKSYHLYFDNFFSSVSLLIALLEKGLYACGTARQNYKDFPPALKMNGKSKSEMEKHGLVKRGDYQMVKKDGVLAFLWRDNRVVTVLSTNTQPQQIDTVQRREQDGSRINISCPAAMALYNSYMGGVDKNDQLRQYYHVRLKCRKFYRYIFWFLFEVAVANAHILRTHYSGAKRQPFKEFRLELAKGLVGDYHSKKRHNRHSGPPTNLPFLHFPVKYSESDTTVRGRCWYCWNKRRPQRRRDTPWYCHECQMYLCHTGVVDSDCFIQHHRDRE